MNTINERTTGRGIFPAAAFLILALASFGPSPARAQWTTSGTNTTTTNNVGVGTPSPQSNLHISTSSTAARGVTDEQTSNDANPAVFTFSKTRAGGAVMNGDGIGSLYAAASDGTNILSPTRMRFSVDGPVATGSVPTSVQFFTGSSGTGTERMRISSAGNFGFWTSTPGMVNGLDLSAFVALHLKGGAVNSAFALVDSHMPSSGFALNDSSQPANGRLWAMTQAAGGGKLTFSTFTDNGQYTNRVVIDRSGNVGVGTVSPSFPLDVTGKVRSSSGGFVFPDGTTQVTASAGTVTGVSAGAGLSGGGTGGALTLSVAAGTGVTSGAGGVSVNYGSAAGTAVQGNTTLGVTAGSGLSGGGQLALGAGGTLTLTNDDKGSAQSIFKNVANAAGATQFSAASNNDAIRFEGTGGTTVSFDAAAKKVTVGSAAPLGFGSTAGTAVQGNTTLTVAAGAGLAGGGTSTLGAGGTLTLNVGAGTGLTAGPDSVSVNYGSAAGTAVQGNTSLTVTAGQGMTGGGQVTLGAGGSVTLDNSDRGSAQNIFKNVGNAAGATQFSAGSNSDTISFEGTGSTTVSFDAAARRVTINSSASAASGWTEAGASLSTTNASASVGVGVASPQARLHVGGAARLDGTSGRVYLGGVAAQGARGLEVVEENATTFSLRHNDPGVAWQNIAINPYAGKVGVNTLSPLGPLSVGDASSSGSDGFLVLGKNNGAGGTRQFRVGFDQNFNFVIGDYGGNNTAGAWSSPFAVNWQAPNDSLHINASGNVGVGTAAPAAKLDVNANSNTAVAINATGAIHASGAITGATVSATYQDVAEWVPSVQKLSAGTVVVLDAGRTNHVVASSGAYDTKAAGVVSAQPGVILGVGGEGKVMVATTGRVRVRVDATRGAISVGDLLVTSGVEGVAMRSVPVDLAGTPIHRPGTIIGKALEPLASGTGEILVLLSLQ